MRVDLSLIKNFDAFQDKYIAKIIANCIATEHGCLEWQKCTKQGYGVIRYSFLKRNNSKHSGLTSPHKLIYMLAHDLRYIEPDRECSHRCGNRLCCEVDHITLESKSNNSQRTTCHKRKVCSKEHYPECIIH